MGSSQPHGPAGFRVCLALPEAGTFLFGSLALFHGHCGSYPNLLRVSCLASGPESWWLQLWKSPQPTEGWALSLKTASGDFPGRLAVKTPLQEARVGSLVGELRPHMPCSVARK